MTTRLDHIIARLESGLPVTVYILQPDTPRGCTSPHGTRSRYCNGACRCQPCRQAATAAHRRWRMNQRDKGNP